MVGFRDAIWALLLGMLTAIFTIMSLKGWIPAPYGTLISGTLLVLTAAVAVGAVFNWGG